MHSAWFRSTFLRVLKFLQRSRDLIFWENQILKKVWIIWSPLLYFNFKSLMDTISSSSIRFQSFLHDLGVLFSESWNFYKLKWANLISAAAQFCRKSELFGPPFCVSLLKVSWTQILLYSSQINVVCMIQE